MYSLKGCQGAVNLKGARRQQTKAQRWLGANFSEGSKNRLKTGTGSRCGSAEERWKINEKVKKSSIYVHT
jgi:hypothetical protein